MERLLIAQDYDTHRIGMQNRGWGWGGDGISQTRMLCVAVNWCYASKMTWLLRATWCVDKSVSAAVTCIACIPIGATGRTAYGLPCF